jgi:hypothetical protein
MEHEIIDTIALITSILALIPLWRDQGRRALALIFLFLVIIFGAYIWWNYHRERAEERVHELELLHKEQQVIDLLCHAGANYEEIYSKTTLGFANGILDDAIDDLMQNKQLVTIDDISVKYPGTPPRDLTVRMFNVKPSACTS